MTYLVQPVLKKLAAGEKLSESETFSLFEELMRGVESDLTDGQIAAFLSLNAVRLPTADELVGAARSLRKHMQSVEIESSVQLLDTCGTGGSGLDSFNTSSAVAFVAAGAGQPVAKHGNRASTSRSGSADVLQSLGVNIEVPVTTISRCIEQVGFGFLYAPLHHPATKRVAKLRKELGFRTLFNVVGPLSNPARAVYQLVGVSSRALLEPVAEALSRLGVKRAIVAWGHDGLDEITLSGPSDIIKVDGDERRRKTISPEMFGLKPRPFAEFSGRIPADAADIIERVLNGEAGAYRDLIVLNAGAALFVSEKAESIEAGIELAHESIDSGNARSVLEQLREMCPM